MGEARTTKRYIGLKPIKNKRKGAVPKSNLSKKAIFAVKKIFGDQARNVISAVKVVDYSVKSVVLEF